MEDLSSLRLSLGVRSVRTAPGHAAAAEEDDAFPALGGPSLAQEIFRKFSGKTQPESRQLVAILTAVQEVVRAQGLEVTPTAMFAALMARCGAGGGGGRQQHPMAAPCACCGRGRGAAACFLPTPVCPPLPRSLENPETLGSGEVLAAMCHLLSLVLQRVPNAILRAKFAAGSAVLCGILEAKQVRSRRGRVRPG